MEILTWETQEAELRGGGSATRVTDGDADGITDRGKHIDRSCGVVRETPAGARRHDSTTPMAVGIPVSAAIGGVMC